MPVNWAPAPLGTNEVLNYECWAGKLIPGLIAKIMFKRIPRLSNAFLLNHGRTNGA